MTRIPEPELTPDGPAYEGRLLHRSDEKVVDQGVRFDIGTILSRRGVFSLLGIGAGTALLAACTPVANATITATPTMAPVPQPTTLPAGEIPDETAGPFPGDGSNGPDVLSQSGVVRSDIRTDIGGGTPVDGAPMTLTLRILDMAAGDVPFAGAAVYIWQCDAQGRYSMYSSGVTERTSLRGVQVADADGIVRFTSVFPGCYPGRWPHIHFEVFQRLDAIADADNAIATSQVALPQHAAEAVYALPAYAGAARNLAEVSLATDGVFGEDEGELQLGSVSGDPTRGADVTLTVRVDTSTPPATGGRMRPRSR